MSAPLVPSPLDYVGRRRFAFYPAISHPDPNEWLLGASSWAEVQAVNAYTEREIWVPRQYIGAVSETSSQVLLVGLTQPLHFREGNIEPRVKQIIEMPHSFAAPGPKPLAAVRKPSNPGAVVAIRLEEREDSTLTKALIGSFIAVLVVSLLAALISAATSF